MHNTPDVAAHHAPDPCEAGPAAPGARAPGLQVSFISLADSMAALLRGSPGAPTGGAEHQLIVIGRELRRLGHKVEFLVCDPDSRSAWQTDEGMDVVPGLQPARGPKFLRALPPLMSQVSALRRSKANIFYVWGVNRLTGVVAAYCRLARRPYVFALQSNMDIDGTYESRLGAADRWLFRRALGDAAAVVAQTRVQSDLLADTRGIGSVVVPNLCRVRDGSDAHSTRDCVTWVGSFRQVKRPYWFLELARRLPGHRFVMIGGRYSGEPTLFDEIREKAQGTANLTVTGQLSFEETRGFYARSLVHVLTSETEGFPNVILEALSSGTPVVTTFDPDGIVAGNALGYSCGELEEVVEKTRLLLTDGESRVEMGERGIAYVRANHDPGSIAKRMAEVFSSVARRQGR